MKKLVFAIIALVAFAFNASAQHAGQNGLGVKLGAAHCTEKGSDLTNFVIGARFNHSFTDLVRVGIDLDYGVADKNVSTFEATANVNFMIPLSEKVYLYPLAGLGYGNIHANTFIGSFNNSKMVMNIGIGAEYEVTEHFGIGAEFKYQYMKDFGRLPVTLDFMYKF